MWLLVARMQRLEETDEEAVVSEKHAASSLTGTLAYETSMQTWTYVVSGHGRTK